MIVKTNPNNRTHSVIVEWTEHEFGAHSYLVTLLQNGDNVTSSFARSNKHTFQDLDPGQSFDASVISLNKRDIPSAEATSVRSGGSGNNYYFESLIHLFIVSYKMNNYIIQLSTLANGCLMG